MGLVMSLKSNDKSDDDRGRRFWLRRQAIQIAAQLPEDRQEASQVLDYARELVDFTHQD